MIHEDELKQFTDFILNNGVCKYGSGYGTTMDDNPLFNKDGAFAVYEFNELITLWQSTKTTEEH